MVQSRIVITNGNEAIGDTPPLRRSMNHLAMTTILSSFALPAPLALSAEETKTSVAAVSASLQIPAAAPTAAATSVATPAQAAPNRSDASGALADQATTTANVPTAAEIFRMIAKWLFSGMPSALGFCFGIFATAGAKGFLGGDVKQCVTQVSVVAVTGAAFIVTLIIASVLDETAWFRIEQEDERFGLYQIQHSESGYNP